MEMVISAYALNIASDEAIAPRRNMVSWLMIKITGASLPSHILALTSVDV